MTFVLWALINQNKEGFHYLLSHGANPNLQLTESVEEMITAGNSALSAAAMLEDTWFLAEALKYGGNPNLVNPWMEETPLYESIFRRRAAPAKMLIAAGADINFPDRDGDTPMMTASRLIQYETVYSLLKAGADPYKKNKWGHDLVWDIENDHADPNGLEFKWRTKVIELLKSTRADPNRLNNVRSQRD